MCQLWAEVLNLPEDKVGIEDNFFRLGGDSILSIRLVSRLNKAFNSQITVRDIFELKYIAKLTEKIITTTANPKKISTYVPFSLVDIARCQTFGLDLNMVQDIYPASYLQMGMLLESNLKSLGTYIDVMSYAVKADYIEKKFITIWEELVKKHELLRAGFILSETGWSVVVYKHISLKYQLYLDKNTHEMIEQERLSNFDYAEPGLFRLRVNDLGDHFQLLFTCHHAIADGWSVASLINEFISAYINNNIITPSPELSYGEFVSNELIAIKNQQNINFWKEYLTDFMVIRGDWKFDTKQSLNNLYLSEFTLNKQQSLRVHSLAKEFAISVDCIFLLCYLKTLAFFTGLDDITIGLVVNNRIEKEGGDKLLGLFLNTIPFRFEPNQNLHDAKILLSIFEQKLKLQNYKQLPYGYIKSLFKQDLFDFAFNFVHFHIMKTSLAHIEFKGGFERTNIPFIFNVMQRESSDFFVTIAVHDNYISKEFLEYFTLYCKECLNRILTNPASQLSLIEDDYQKIICEWNRTCQDFPGHKTLVQLFTEQVEQTPDKIAVTFQDQSLSYDELNRKSNQLACFYKDLSAAHTNYSKT